MTTRFLHLGNNLPNAETSYLPFLFCSAKGRPPDGFVQRPHGNKLIQPYYLLCHPFFLFL